jgi:hypothetical protein
MKAKKEQESWIRRGKEREKQLDLEEVENSQR